MQRTSQHRKAEPCRYGELQKRFVKVILTRVVCKNVVLHIASQERNQDLKLPSKVHADLLFFCKCRRRVDVVVLRKEKRFLFQKTHVYASTASKSYSILHCILVCGPYEYRSQLLDFVDMARGPLCGPSTLQVPLSAQFCCSTVGGNFVFLTLAIRSYTPGQASTKLT